MGDNTRKEVNNLFLIGAGFTKAVFPDAPLNADLLRSVCEHNPDTLLRKYEIRYRTDDIEILLTRMDLETVELQSERLTKDRERINHELAKYFCAFRFTEELLPNNQWLESFAKRTFRPNDAILTLNYDSFLEGLLDYYEVWSPVQGYAALNNNPLLDSPPNPKNIRIFKIHGFEHFVEARGLPDKTKTAIGFPVDESIYPRSGKHRFFGYGLGDLIKGPYIIAPSFVKTPHQDIELMMMEALKIAAHANNLIVVGSSLRWEDGFLWLLLTNFLNQERDNRRLVIVDPCAETLAKKIVDHYFVDIRELVRIMTLPKMLQNALEELISELGNAA